MRARLAAALLVLNLYSKGSEPRLIRRLVGLLVLVMAVSAVAGRAHADPPAENGCIPLARLASADLDGDHKQDALLGAASPSRHGYRSLLVRSATGQMLLDITNAGYYYLADVADLGAPNLVLLAGSPFGNKWLNLEAWVVMPGRGFERLRWDGAFEMVGVVVATDSKAHEVVVDTPTGKKAIRYANGQLQSVTAPLRRRACGVGGCLPRAR